MCKFFSCIGTEKGEIYFTEDDSHKTCIERLQNEKQQDYVRIKIIKGIYYLDTKTIPEWYKRIAVKLEQRAMWVYKEVKWYHDKYEKNCRKDRAKYTKNVKKAWLEYVKIHKKARAAFTIIVERARLEYKKDGDATKCDIICKKAREEYLKIEVPAWAGFLKIEGQAWAECATKCEKPKAIYIYGLSTITGFLPVKEWGAGLCIV